MWPGPYGEWGSRKYVLAMSLAWTLRGGKITSALIGASRVSQVEENIAALTHTELTQEELERIETILKTENDVAQAK